MASSTSTAMRAAAPGRRRTARRPSTRRRGSRGRQDNWWPVAIVAALVLLGVAWARSADDVPAEGTCTVDGGTVTVSAEQARHATTIARVARDRGLPDRAVVIALATAQQESGLRNLDYGDRDSLGLFQQRPSQGWGDEGQVQDPAYAAGIFFDRLLQVPGWDSGRLTDVAQSVQRSGHPDLYQQWEPMAGELAAALAPGADVLHCA
jgi:hypothetical protein